MVFFPPWFPSKDFLSYPSSCLFGFPLLVPPCPCHKSPLPVIHTLSLRTVDGVRFLLEPDPILVVWWSVQCSLHLLSLFSYVFVPRDAKRYSILPPVCNRTKWPPGMALSVPRPGSP